MKDIERALVSAYADGEVEAPWNEKVKAKIETDPDWARELELHRSVKAALAADREPDWATALVPPLAKSPAGIEKKRWAFAPPLAWASVVAAALLFVAGSAGFWLGRQSSPSTPTSLAELKVQVPQQLQLQMSGEGQVMMASTLDRVEP